MWEGVRARVQNSYFVRARERERVRDLLSREGRISVNID